MRSHLAARSLIPLLVAAVGFAHAALAGFPPPDTQSVPDGCKKVLDALPGPGDPNLALQIHDGLFDSPVCVAQVMAQYGLEQALEQALVKASSAERKTNLKQAGAPPGSGGTTSLLSKSATPSILATELGGITSSTTNQTVTLQTSLDAIPRALAVNGLDLYCSTPLVEIYGLGCTARDTLDQLAPWGVGITVNTSPESKAVTGTATGQAQGQAQQVSLSSAGSRSPSFAGAFLKYQIIKGKAKLPDYSSLISEANLQGAALAIFMKSLRSKSAADWQQCVTDKMTQAPVAQRTDVFLKYYTQVVHVLADDGYRVDCGDKPAPSAVEPGPHLSQAMQALATYIKAASQLQAQFDQNIEKEAAKTPPLTAELDYNTPENQPANWIAKLVGSYTFDQASKSPGPTLSYNVGASIYGSTPSSSIPGASLLRDVQAGLESDWNIGAPSPPVLKWIGASTVTVAVYDQYQTSPSILNVTPGSPVSGVTIVGLPSTATQIFTQKGNIFVAQARWGLGTSTNARFPLSLTYASRTELIARPTWGAQFGVSYDFTALLPSGGGSKQ